MLLSFLVLPLCFVSLWAQESPAPGNEQQPAAENQSVVRAGAGLGSVAGLNLVAEVQLSQLEIGVSGAYWSKNYNGLSLHLAVPFFQFADFAGSVAALGGVHRAPIPAGDGTENIPASKTQPFLGSAVIFYLTNFYVQTGLEFGFNDRPANLQPFWQFGYLFRL